MTEIKKTAQRFREEGLNIFTLPYGSKIPDHPWGQYKDRFEMPWHFEREMSFEGDRNLAVVCGLGSGNLVGLDWDTEPGTTDYHKRFYEQCPPYRKICDNTLINSTSRGPRIWIQTPAPVKTKKIADLQIDVKAHGSYFLTPPSKHPTNPEAYRWLQENKPIYKLGDFRQIPFIEFEPIDEEDIFNMLPKWGQLVLSGSKAGKRSRSEAEMKLVTYLIGHRYTPQQVIQIFDRYAKPKTHFAEHASRRSYLWALIETAQSWLETQKTTVNEIIEAAYYALKLFNFKGNAKGYDFAVALAFLDRAWMMGSVTNLEPSLRDIAKGANVSYQAVKNAIKRIPFLLYEKNFDTGRYVYNIDTTAIQLNGKRNLSLLRNLDTLKHRVCTHEVSRFANKSLIGPLHKHVSRDEIGRAHV